MARPEGAKYNYKYMFLLYFNYIFLGKSQNTPNEEVISVRLGSGGLTAVMIVMVTAQIHLGSLR